MGDGNSVWGEMHARVLKLVRSSVALAFAVPNSATDHHTEQTQNTASAIQIAGDADVQKQQKEILKRHLQQALLWGVLFWTSWRGRKLLLRGGRAMVWASLAPLREL